MSDPELTDEALKAFLIELSALTTKHGIAIQTPEDYGFDGFYLRAVHGPDLRYEFARDRYKEPVYALAGEIPFPPTAEEIEAERAAEAREAELRKEKLAAGYAWDHQMNAWRDADGSL